MSKKTFDTFSVDAESVLLDAYLDAGYQDEHLTDMSEIRVLLDDEAPAELIKFDNQVDTSCDCVLLVKAF